MKSIITTCFAAIICQTALCQDIILPLWPAGKVPNYKKTAEAEKRDSTDIVRFSLVQTPDISVYLPSKKIATGQAVIICPGGGYGVLAYNWEGSDPARLFCSKGITAIVLKYRLPNSKSNITPHLSPLMDAKRAMRLVRANAAKWNINKKQCWHHGIFRRRAFSFHIGNSF